MFGHSARGTYDLAAWAFYQYKTVTGVTTESKSTTSAVISQIGLNANYGNKENNPTAGHAVGPDIKPYSMRVLYLISY